jgi:hypothetical protein
VISPLCPIRSIGRGQRLSFHPCSDLRRGQKLCPTGS